RRGPPGPGYLPGWSWRCPPNGRSPPILAVRPGSGARRAFAVPGDVAGETLADRHLRGVAEQAAGLGDVGEGDRHVAGLIGEHLDPRLDAELGGDPMNEVDQRGGLRAAEVEDLELRGQVERRHHAVDDVVDVGVVA